MAAKLGEQSLLTPEITSSNLVIGKFYFNCIEQKKNKEKQATISQWIRLVLQPWVRIPSTTIELFSFSKVEFDTYAKREKQETIIGRFIKKSFYSYVTKTFHFQSKKHRNVDSLFKISFNGVTENILHLLDQFPASCFHLAAIVVQGFGQERN